MAVPPPAGEPSEAENARFKALVAELRSLVDTQAERIAALESEVAELRSRLGQDSATTSAPPSRDRSDRRQRRAAERAEAKQRQRAERGGEQRRPGKQPGAPGSTLLRREPDATVVHTPSGAGPAGRAWPTPRSWDRRVARSWRSPHPAWASPTMWPSGDAAAAGSRPRPASPPRPARRCAGDHGPRPTPPTCWVASTSPWNGPQRRWPTLFAAPMGQGSLAGVLPDAARRLAGFVGRIGELIAGCAVVHADETSIRVGTALGWVHTVSTVGLTLLAYHDRRGIEAVCDIAVLNHFTGTIVHDGWASYDRPELAKATHAQCGAHLLRHLDKVALTFSQRPWATTMRTVLLDAKAASAAAAAAGLATVPVATATAIATRYRAVLDTAFAGLPPGPPPRRKHTGGWATFQREAWNLATRLRDGEDQVLALLADTQVPFDNNEAEVRHEVARCEWARRREGQPMTLAA